MREKSPEKDNSERYLLTYADLMNLLLILFIVLFCMATKDVKKTNAVMAGIAKGFGTTSSSGLTGNSKAGASSKASAPTSDYSDFLNQLVALLQKRGVLNKVDITENNSEVVITLKDNVLFARGRYDLGSDSVGLLHTIGSLMSKLSFGAIYVEGYTDSDPIHNSEVRDNMELSQKRAYNVYYILKEAGVDPTKLFTAGFGELYPVAPNDTVADKAKNRRVVIAIVRKGLVPADESASTSEIQQLLQNANDDKTKNASSKQSSTKKTTGKASTGAAGKSASPKKSK